jgi:hypothetical protein
MLATWTLFKLHLIFYLCTPSMATPLRPHGARRHRPRMFPSGAIHPAATRPTPPPHDAAPAIFPLPCFLHPRSITVSPSLLGRRRLQPGRRGGAGRRRAPAPTTARTTSCSTATWELAVGVEWSADMAAVRGCSQAGELMAAGRRRLQPSRRGGAAQSGPAVSSRCGLDPDAEWD